MRVLLIKLPEPRAPGMKVTCVPPLGLWAIRSTIHNVYPEWSVDVVDMHLGDDLPLCHEYDLVGISAQFSTQDRAYREVAARARERWPDARIVAGGFHAAVSPKPAPDVEIAVGSGEAYFSRNPSTWWMPRFGIDEIGRYWSLGAPHDLQSRSRRWMPLETSRGCGRRCGYCGVRSFWGDWSAFDHAALENHLGYLVANMGVEEVFLEDDNVAWDQAHLEHVVALLEKYGLAWSTPNGIDIRGMLPQLPSFRASGCWRLSLPFETGSAHTAQVMGLGQKFHPYDEALEVVKRVSGEGIATCGFFIIGYPGETIGDIERTLEYANALPLDQRNIYIATPYPGTRLYDVCLRHGYLRYKPPELYDRLTYTQGLIDTPEWTGEQIVEIRRRDREAAIARRAAQ